MARNPVLRLLDWGRTTPWFVGLLSAFVVAVTFWGFVEYYGPQFQWIYDRVGWSEWWIYLFVPDCPLFGLLFVPTLLLDRIGIRNNTLTAFIALGNVKFGLWTIFVLLYYFNNFFGAGGSEAILRGTILALHIGMVPLGLMLWRLLRPLQTYQFALILGGSLLWDYFDYWYTLDYQVYPSGLPRAAYGVPVGAEGLGVVPEVTVGLTVGLTLLLALAQRSPLRQKIQREDPARA